MKELSIEEKAKRYDEALKVLHKYDGANIMFSQSLKEEMFPELIEKSKDEKIKREIIRIVDIWTNSAPIVNGIPRETLLAWLEKQKPAECSRVPSREMVLNVWELGNVWKGLTKGSISTEHGTQLDYILKHWTKGDNYDKIISSEQKPADRVKPKFKIGDWIIDDNIKNPYLITDTSNGKYDVISTYGNDFVFSFNEVEHFYHLWTIRYAKDGDVLAWDDSKCIALFKNIFDKDSFNSHGFVGHCTGTFESRQAYHDIEGAHPATKEQRDLLFQKMKEAGYEWDANKKELRKIKDEFSWSEEDERKLEESISLIKSNSTGTFYYERNELISFLKSLKDKVQPQPNQVWSEKDGNLLSRCICDFDYLIKNENRGFEERYKEQIDWLKSLRPQSQWKPSDKQMEALWNVYCGGKEQAELATLYTDLKKLREK